MRQCRDAAAAAAAAAAAVVDAADAMRHCFACGSALASFSNEPVINDERSKLAKFRPRGLLSG